VIKDGLMLDVQSLDIEDVKLIRFARHADRRGHFCETYSHIHFAAAGLAIDWVQDNEALSVAAGTIRGLHFQRPPHAQAKLVRAVHGRVFDVAVDLRRGSPQFGHHVGVILDSARAEALLIPEGFAHGYCTLTPNALVQYKVSRRYAPEAEGSLLWRDRDLAIPWPISAADMTIAERDDSAPSLADLVSPF
jgi:dTDP-4-dehydrorhamnose 3,5-epimerase